MTARHLDPKVRTVWRVTTFIAAAAVTAAAAIPAAIAALSDQGPPLLSMAAIVGAAIVVGGVAVWRLPDLVYRSWTYEVGEDALELQHGVVTRTASSIPYFRVQHVDTEQGPIDRRLGLARLKLHTASAATDASLPGLTTADADALRRTILDRAGAGDAV